MLKLQAFFIFVVESFNLMFAVALVFFVYCYFEVARFHLFSWFKVKSFLLS